MPKHEEVYRQLRPERKALEALRLRILGYKENYIWWVIIFTLFATILAGFQFLLPDLAKALFGRWLPTLYVFGTIPVFAAIVYFFMIYLPVRQFHDAFKRKLVGKTAEKLLNLQYFPDRGISSRTFKQSQLFSAPYNIYYSTNLLSGTIGKTDVWISQLKVEYVYKTDSQQIVHEIFSGILFMADFHKEFNGRLWITPDFAERVLGPLGKSLQKWQPKGELVSLEDPEFERMFKVVGTDQVEARYILSPGMMQRIKDIRTRWRRDIRLSFFDSKVAIALPTKYNFFEADLNKSLLNGDEFLRVCEELELWAQFVEDLNLNTRIWSKE